MYVHMYVRTVYNVQTYVCVCMCVCILYNNEQLKMVKTGGKDLDDDDDVDALMCMI